MATDYFSHCAFGVVLEGKEHEAFEAQYDLARAKLIEAYRTARKFEGDEIPDDELDKVWLESLQDLDKEEFKTVVEAVPDDVLAAIRESVGAPDDAHFISSGDDDDERPGRCYTGTGTVIVGYGPFAALQLLAKKFKPEFRKRVNYESWVTSG